VIGIPVSDRQGISLPAAYRLTIMCGRFTRHHKPEEIAERFDVETIEEAAVPRYNIAPSQMVPVIRRVDGREMIACKWGLIPYWSKDPKIGNKMINAKGETLAEKASFKTAFAKRRCLIPADGFYEWTRNEKDQKQPIYYKLRNNQLFAFAGLWEVWRTPDGEKLRTFTIITVEPNELLASIHNRMPAILRPEDEALWLDPNISETGLVPLLKPYPAVEMESYPVSTAVNSPKLDDPSFVIPI
jgi:putative SOS response-associated peptidase YedK